MTRYKGQCHCGNIKVEYISNVPPGDTIVRACQCEFCRMHQSLAVSDPNGSLVFTETKADTVHAYRFGLKTSDFIVCRSCGAYAGALMHYEGKTVGIANIHLFDNKAAFSAEPAGMDYDAEDQAARIARRAEKWMPARLERMTE